MQDHNDADQRFAGVVSILSREESSRKKDKKLNVKKAETQGVWDGRSSQWSTFSASTRNSERLSQFGETAKLAQKYEMWLKMQNEKDSKEETKRGADGPAES